MVWIWRRIRCTGKLNAVLIVAISYLGDEPLLGAVSMKMMDLLLHQATQTLSVNPASPYIPVALAK
jgi:hypothetical protein